MSFIRKLLFLFYFSFLLMALAGIFLIYQSNQNSLNEVQIEISQKDGFRVDLSTAVPGVIVFLIGSCGLILMLVKVPVKAIVGYEQPNGASESVQDEIKHFNLHTHIPEPILSDKVERLPVIIWWAIKHKGIVVRANGNVCKE